MEQGTRYTGFRPAFSGRAQTLWGFEPGNWLFCCEAFDGSKALGHCRQVAKVSLRKSLIGDKEGSLIEGVHPPKAYPTFCALLEAGESLYHPALCHGKVM